VPISFVLQRQLRCRFSGSCHINANSRRQCSYCRLQKCFEVNMRKEWIRTEEEQRLRQLRRTHANGRDVQRQTEIVLVQRRKNRPRSSSTTCRSLATVAGRPLTTNVTSVQSRQLSMHRDWSRFSVDEYSLLLNIDQSYDRWALTCDTSFLGAQPHRRSSFVELLNGEHEMFRSLIEFYKRIPEFGRVHVDDQVLLIKCNLSHLVHIHHVLRDKFNEGPQIGCILSESIGTDFYRRMSRTRRFYARFLDNPVVLKLALVVFIFTMNLSRSPVHNGPDELNDRSALVKAQDLYVTLLWKYLTVTMDETSARRAMELLVCQYLRYQSLMHQMDAFIDKQVDRRQLHPLTQSVCRLT
jgi:hypothetical protein